MDFIKNLNKKADIPVTILVIGVFAVCGLAILSFYVSNTNQEKKIIGIGLMENINSIAEEIRFYESIGKTPEETAEILNKNFNFKKEIQIKVESQGDYYLIKEDYVIETGFGFWKKQKTLISVEYKFKL